MATNLILITGRLTREVELKRTKTDKDIAVCGLCWSQKFGKDREEKVFVDIEAWEGAAKALAKLSKGQLVELEGKLKQDNWEDKETGAKRSKILITVSRVHYIEWPKDDASDNRTDRGREQDRERSEKRNRRDQDEARDYGDSGDSDEAPWG